MKLEFIDLKKMKKVCSDVSQTITIFSPTMVVKIYQKKLFAENIYFDKKFSRK